MVERLNGIQEVVGSIPIVSTTAPNGREKYRKSGAFFVLLRREKKGSGCLAAWGDGTAACVRKLKNQDDSVTIREKVGNRPASRPPNGVFQEEKKEGTK